MKSKTLGIAIVAAIGVFSTSAFAVSPYGNGTQKGSLLIFPKIDITAGRDTFVQITNDFSGPVTLKCYYQTSEPAPNFRTKHKTDFTVNLTKNQTTWWFVRDGAAGSGFFRQGVPQFSPMADGYVATAGELKCWAVTADLTAEIHFNHLVGTATVVDGGNAFTYNAYSFQALTPGQGSINTNTVLPTPGVLALNNVEYDSCSLQAIGNAFATTGPYPATAGYSGQIDLVQCNQDLRETYTPPVTKYVFEFWSENENKFTGTEVCGDSWIEKDLWDLQESRFQNLKTTASYFRVSAVGQICVGGRDGGVMGVLSQRWPNGALTGSTLNGRGNFIGQILYDVSGGDITKQ